MSNENREGTADVDADPYNAENTGDNAEDLDLFGQQNSQNNHQLTSDDSAGDAEGLGSAPASPISVSPIRENKRDSGTTMPASPRNRDNSTPPLEKESAEESVTKETASSTSSNCCPSFVAFFFKSKEKTGPTAKTPLLSGQQHPVDGGLIHDDPHDIHDDTNKSEPKRFICC
jgi:hypothetical protein